MFVRLVSIDEKVERWCNTNTIKWIEKAIDGSFTVSFVGGSSRTISKEIYESLVSAITQSKTKV